MLTELTAVVNVSDVVELRSVVAVDSVDASVVV